ncbi:MAG: hypothetical protein RLY58_1953 [Pseudomonadota bacterium]|jgi:hypothetical protein
MQPFWIDGLLMLVLIAHVVLVTYRLGVAKVAFDQISAVHHDSYYHKKALQHAVPDFVVIGAMYAAMLWRTTLFLQAIGLWGGGAVVLLVLIGLYAFKTLLYTLFIQGFIKAAKYSGRV